MDFLHRRRSVTLAHFDHASSVGNDKPLPSLPAAESAPLPKMTPVENIARNRSASSTAGGLIRRVSSIFSSRKKRPSALKLAHRNIPRIYESCNSSSLTLSEEDEDDDIRRPSGLGSAASFTSNRSMPPSPFTPSYDPESLSTTPFGYVRARASSTPNLLRSLSLRSRGSKKKGRPSKEFFSHTASQNASQIQLHTHSALTILCIPAETMAIVLSHLPKTSVARTANTCRLFASASRTVLYSHVDLRTLTETQLEKFIALLASRRDFTDLARTFTCESWPAFFLTTSPSMISPGSTSTSTSSASYASLDPEVQHRNTLLTATFTLAFQRMSNLTSLTLPAYDHDLLAHHTAFGLRNITFVCPTLFKEEASELFAWLDGQTNVTTLLFPNLSHDCDYGAVEPPVTPSRPTKAGRPATSSGPMDQSLNEGKKYLTTTFPPASPSRPSPTTIPSPTSTISKSKAKLSPRPKTAAPASPSYLSTTFTTPGSSVSSNSSLSSRYHSKPQIPFPMSSGSIHKLSNVMTTTNPKRTSASPLASLTLLPNLTTLHGPPSLIIALSPSPSSDIPQITNRPRPRPLKTITLNISSTLYTGLRPATLVQRLNGVTRNLGLCFGENVDRRTVEKMLGAAGSVLGGSGSGMEKSAKGKAKEETFAIGYKFGEGEWKGLVQLDVKFIAIGGPGSDEGWHKLISSAIPRYPHLRVLRLSYTHTRDNRDHDYSTNTPRTANAYSPLLGSSPIISSTPATPTPAEILGFYNSPRSQATRKELSPPEKAYIRQWTKHCPRLEKVLFLSGAEWWRRRK